MLIGLIVIILLMQKIKAKGDAVRYGPQKDFDPDSSRNNNRNKEDEVDPDGVEGEFA